jgi:plastocyanin
LGPTPAGSKLQASTKEVTTMSVRTLAAFAVFGAVALGLGGCGEEGQAEAMGEELRIVGTEMAFSPEALTTPTGQHPIVFTNEGVVYHELALVSPGGTVLAARSVPAGETADFEVELDRPGTYQLLCREPGHTEAGMVGTLKVID